MIDFWPVILKSSESDFDLWLEVKADPKGEKEKIRLYLIAHSGTFNPAHLTHDIYEGAEEGFYQLLYDASVSRTEFEEMIDETINQLKTQETVKLNHDFECDKELKGLQISFQLLTSVEDTISYQIFHKRGLMKSNFQLRSTRKDVLEFTLKIKEKLGRLKKSHPPNFS